MSFPERAQMLQIAFWQGHVTIAIAFARANVQQHAPGIDVAHLQVQSFTQTQSAAVNGDQCSFVVQNGDAAEDGANFLGREDDGQFELRLRAGQLQLRRPNPPQGFLPKQFDGAKSLRGSLAGDLLDAFQMNEILPQLLGGYQIRSGLEILVPIGKRKRSMIPGSVEKPAGASDHQRRIIGWDSRELFFMHNAQS